MHLLIGLIIIGAIISIALWLFQFALTFLIVVIGFMFAGLAQLGTGVVGLFRSNK